MYTGAMGGVRSCHRRRSGLSTMPPGRTRCWTAATRWRHAKSMATRIPSPPVLLRGKPHIAFFNLLAAGDTKAALSALPAHLDGWPRDALVLGTTAFTNGC